MSTTRAAVCAGLDEPWKTEEIEIDAPHSREVRVKMVWSGMCHSDEHLRTGDISAPQEVLELMGVKSMFPVVGGHEGAGIVTEVGPNVTQVSEGDHVAVSFIPSCGTCFWCASGRQNLCDLGMATLAGPMISDGTYRYHLDGEPVNRMAQLGTFADEMVVHENSLVRIEPWHSMKAAALISCGISTGFGSAVDRAKVKPGETVVVAGCGGVGSGAIQGARIAGARNIIAVDPVPYKLERAKEFGATHTAGSLLDAQFMLPELTQGRNADVVILTPGVLRGEMIAAACSCGSKDARIVVTAIAPFSQMDVQLNLFNLAMFNQAILGTVFGSQSPRVQVPNLLQLYDNGQLLIDELITQEYTIDQVQQGYDDQAAGTIIRGVVKFDE
ncbi:MAG TPA: NDMA-dependent alcohol dehydrogenase [Acidimicrobiales bacterium]|nr:NDMA-dependent alcohol dehydrogenase [Acidimicrobiales bacterium]